MLVAYNRIVDCGTRSTPLGIKEAGIAGRRTSYPMRPYEGQFQAPATGGGRLLTKTSPPPAALGRNPSNQHALQPFQAFHLIAKEP